MRRSKEHRLENSSIEVPWTATYHVIDYPDRVSYRTRLKSHIVHPTHQIIHRDWTTCEFIEIELFDFLSSDWHLV